MPFVATDSTRALIGAGLYAARKEGDEWKVTFTIITREARDASGEIHDRMPVFLTPDVLDLLAVVAKAPAQSLVIIDEVEASLHPQAQRGLMTELLRIAEGNKIQIILSTHSPFILEQLPPRARIFISMDRDANRQILHGVSAEFALNLMDDERHDELDVYCEDENGAYVIDRIAALGSPASLSRIRITPVGPASTVKALAEVAAKKRLPRPSLSVLDADQSAGPHHIVLPGDKAPEKELILGLADTNWKAVAERLGCPAGSLLDARDRAVAIEEHHVWPKEIARLLGGLMRPSRVWEAIADVWVVDVLGEAAAKEWCEPLEDALREIDS